MVSTGVRLLIGLLLAFEAAAAVPVMQLSHAMPQQPLAGAMSVAILSAAQPADPDALWAAPASNVESWTDNRWGVGPGERVVGRAKLLPTPEQDMYVVQVPDPNLDRVQVWYRSAGKPWRTAVAGDRVPLSQWPFTGQFPSFPLSMSDGPVDLIVAIENAEPEAVPLWIRTDAAYREARLLQANFAGIVMGLGLMGALMCLVAVLGFRHRAHWVVLAYALWTLVTIACTSGYAAIWFTPEWVAFNDRSKDFSLVIMGALLVAVIAEVLDYLDWFALKRWVGPAAIVGGVAYAVVHTFVIEGGSGPLALAFFEALCVIVSAALCFASWVRGGRHVAYAAAAVAAFAITVALQYDAFDLNYELDITGYVGALLLFGSAQVLRHGLFLRDRFGRDVLGRAAISANRDPLTALLSYPGTELAYEEAVLRHAAGRGAVAVMMFSLRRFDECTLDHGFVLAERSVVRFAAALQRVLGDGWSIGRLSKTWFGALANTRDGPNTLVTDATRVLTHCVRLEDPFPLVGEFDLHIVCAWQDDVQPPFEELLRQVEEVEQAMPEGKRIAAL